MQLHVACRKRQDVSGATAGSVARALPVVETAWPGIDPSRAYSRSTSTYSPTIHFRVCFLPIFVQTIVEDIVGKVNDVCFWFLEINRVFLNM